MQKLEEVIFYTLEKAIKSYRQFAQRRFNEAGIYMTIDQWLVLSYISQNGECYQHEIASAVFKDNASVTRIIEILVSSGFLTRSIHEKDRRRYRLRLTEEGIHLILKARKVVQEYRTAGIRGINPEELLITEKVLKQMTDNCLEGSNVLMC